MRKANFCTACGGQLIPADDTPAAPESAPVAEWLKCSVCGKLHDKGKFCTSCGGQLVSASAAADTVSAIPTPVTPVSSVIPTPVSAPLPNTSTAPISAPLPASTETSGKLVCKVCGKILDKGKFCTACGGELVPMESQTVSAPIAENSSLVCPSCGKTFERGKFCTTCGATLVPQTSAAAPVNDGKLHCVQCGKIFDHGKFCTSCGGQLVTSDKLNV